MFLYNAVNGAVSAIVFLFWGGFGNASVFTVLLGVLFGVITSAQMVATMYALRIGPMSFTTVIVSFSTLLTALSGALFWNEKLKWLQIVGIVLMVISFVFAVERKQDEKRASWKWLLFCLIAAACSGGIGLMQKIHQTSIHKGELNAFLIVAFIVLGSISAIFALFAKMKEKTSLLPRGKNGGRSWWLFALMAVGGGCAAVNNKLNLYLSGVMDSAVFFPIVNGGGLVLATVAALVVFHEKLTKKQWCGVVVGTLSVLCLCL